MSIQDVINAINEGTPLEEIGHLIDEFHIDVDEPVGELRLRAIHHAVFKDRLDCVKLLLSRGCNINARDQSGFTPLHIAARYNRAEMANELISRGGQVDALDSLGCAPLHMALQKGHSKCAEILLQHGAEPNTHYKSIGYEIHALPGIYSDCLELLLSYGADPDVRDSRGFVPLHHATRASNTLYVYILLRNGADPDALTESSLPDIRGKTALQMAVYTDSARIVELLLLYGADANCKDEHRNTPLHHVAAHGNIEIAKLLIQNGAVLTARNSLRYHPLHKACATGADPVMIELLLDNGAFVNSTTSLLETPVRCVLSHWVEALEEVGNSNGNNNDAKLRDWDDRCVSQVLSLLDFGARITVSSRADDPFSVLQTLPSIARLTRTRSLLLEASVETRLVDKTGNVQSQYNTTEFQDVFARATTPTSLLKACRHVIRKALGKTNLPKAVKEMQMPGILQDYLIYRTK